ncbi:MAG: endo-1,4-beta-xylanase [Candidatus Nanopelagicales bacterium]
MARIMVAILSFVLAFTLAPAPQAQAKTYPVVPMELFGMHYHAVGDKTVTFRVGAIRLWDSGVAWARMQPTPGAIDFTKLDRAVKHARDGGAREIQYVFGHTPLWAAADKTVPGPIGNGSSSKPKRLSDFTNFAKAVAKRYKGKITSYEMWNEASLKIYYRGTYKDLAQLVIQGSRAIKSVDPNAKVLTPSITYGVFDRRPGFWKAFAREMRKAKWPVDAVAVHPYSKKPDYLAKRANTIKKTLKFYRKYGFKGPIWDTEVNYGDRRGLGKGWNQVVYTGDKAAGMLARTYIDSMRTGVRRVFWYGWDSHILGIDTIDPKTKQLTSTGIAFQTLQDWMVSKSWLGCKVRKNVRSCRMVGQDGSKSTIVYATSKTRSFKVPAGVRTYQRLSGATVKVVPGKKIKVHQTPILLMGA